MLDPRKLFIARITNTLAYYEIFVNYNTDKKSFITFGLGNNVTKLFTTIIYKCLCYARVIVPEVPFQRGLICMSKATACPSEAPR